MGNNELLNQLPIDQFSRQEWARLIIEQMRMKPEKFKILDVGGYKGKTADFQEKDDVWICDLFDIKEKNYIKGDGRKLPFDNDSFDFVVSFDTFEHVPQKGREEFIRELLRVSRRGVILAAPFDDEGGTVSKAEAGLNDYYKQIYNSDHQWLKEHLDYKIPGAKETENILTKNKFAFTSLKSNDLYTWLITQYVYFSIERDPELRGRVDDINRMYSKNFTSIDKVSELSYRRIYFISHDKNNVGKVENYISLQPDQNDKTKMDYLIFALSTFGRKYSDVVGHNQYLESELATFKESTSKLQQRNKQLEARFVNRAKRAVKKIARGHKHD